MKRLVLSLVSFAAIGLTACQGHAPTGPSESPAFGSPSGALNEDSGGSSLKAGLTANPSTINAGETSTLTWTTSNARSVYLDGVAVAKSGSKNVSPTATKTYSLLAVNGSRRTTSTATVTVSSGSGGSGDGAEAGGDDGTPSPTPPLPTALITAMPELIQSGQSSTLQWSTSNATSVTLNGSAVGANGSRVVSPTVDTTYTIMATNPSGSVQSMVTVTVT